jgi:hypothetical protein
VASELANMIGGNLKSILPAPSVLSIPAIVSGHNLNRGLNAASNYELNLVGAEGRLGVSVYQGI